MTPSPPSRRTRAAGPGNYGCARPNGSRSWGALRQRAGSAGELTGPAGEFLVTMGDGIEVHGNSLAVVRNFANEVATFKLNGQLTSGVLTDQITSADFAIPTTATWAAGDLWAVNARFDVEDPPPDLPYWITRVPGL